MIKDTYFGKTVDEWKEWVKVHKWWIVGGVGVVLFLLVV